MPKYDWDPLKEAENRVKHGLDFSQLERFEWDLATLEIDDREDYGELREKAVSFIGDVMFVLIFTERNDVVRAISLRKATKLERRQYVQSTK